LGIWLTLLVLNTLLGFTGLSGGLYWCYRRDFEAVGGFNEDLIMGEDLDFAYRLKQYGRRRHLKLIKLPSVHITTSMRKCDEFGDWFFLRIMLLHSKEVKKGMRGEYTKELHRFADRFFYERTDKKE
jgi:GT2 family glycosyltransferase